MEAVYDCSQQLEDQEEALVVVDLMSQEGDTSFDIT